MKTADMHTHSTYSDGSMTPAEVVKRAAALGLGAIALTDHDTVGGIAEALEEALKAGLEVMPGVEISTDFNPEMHILGYFNKNDYMRIEAALNIVRENREKRNERIIEKLNKLGYAITAQDAKRYAKQSITARVHIAEALFEKGYTKSIDEGFEKLIGDGRPAYVKRAKITPQEGMMMISQAGGIPVIAHPRNLGIGMVQFEKTVAELKLNGLKGIEVFYADNSRYEDAQYLSVAKRYGLLATGGSDFHGTGRSDVEIGSGRGSLNVDYTYFAAVKAALQAV